MSATPTSVHPPRPQGRMSTRRLLVLGMLVSLFLAGIVSFYASSHPDGLEFVAEKTGFLDSAKDHTSRESPFADYATKGVDNPRLSGGLAGVVGASVVFAFAGGLFMVVRRRDRREGEGGDVTSPED